MGLDTIPQPPSRPGKENVTEAVIQDLKERSEAGAKKYGYPLQTHNGRNALVDAYQEALDLCVYLKQALMEGRGEL